MAGYQARKIASSFGYTQAPVDTYVSFSGGSPALDYWKTHNRQGKSWNDLLAAEPAYQYLYRESPEPLVAWPIGYVDAGAPAPATAGMIEMSLNFAGHLRYFEAIPAEKPASGAPETPFDDAALFKAIGYDPAGFTAASPQLIPMAAYDLRKAWKGPAPGLPDVEVRVEAASLSGRIAAVKVIFPWTKARREPGKPAAGAALFGPLIMMALALVAVLFGLIFAVLNLRRNRGDKKGAFRLALVVALLALLSWIGSAHHVASTKEWDLLLNAMGDAAFAGLALWVLYLALEPTVRSRWPQAMTTWNRLLAGKFGDAQLGAHILTGAAIGLALYIALASSHWIDYRHDGVPFGNDLDGSASALDWIGTNAQRLQNDLISSFLVFFTIFGFRALWRNDYAAAFSTAVLFAVVGNNGIWTDVHPNLLLERLMLLLIFAILAFILIRMGMVSTIATLFFINTPSRINLGPGLSGWYTTYGLASMALLMAIAVYAFWRSIGARTLGGKDPQ